MADFRFQAPLNICWTAVAACLVCSTVSAEVVGLTETQRGKLVALVKSDPEAKAFYETLEREAREALKDEPLPIEKIQSEGKLKNDPVKIKTGQSMRDMRKLHALAWSYSVTGDEALAAKIREFVVAWAKVNVPSGDPIDETGLEPLFVAYEMTRASFPAADKALVDGWLRKVVEAESSHMKKGATTSYNNWHSHRLKIIGMIACVLNDHDLIAKTVDDCKKQIDKNLHADGSSFDFHERDALHYHCYDLEPLLTVAIALQPNVDLYHYEAPSGSSLAKSVKFLVPYCDGSKTHPEFVNSKVAFDQKRAASGDEHYKAGRPFEPKQGQPALELAAFFDNSLASLALKLGGKNERFAGWQMVLNEARR